MAYEISASAAGSYPDTASAAETITVNLVEDQLAWTALTAAAPFPHLTQGWAYGEGKAGNGWTVKRASFSVEGHVVAFATVLERRILGIRVLARINRGPVFLQPPPTPSRVVAVYRALRRRWRGPLLIAPTLEHGEASSLLLRRAGYHRRQHRGWRSGRIDLRQDESALWASFASGFRNRVRNAEKAGATVRIASDDAAYAWMIDRHLENMTEKGFHAADPQFLNALRNSAPGDVAVFQLMQAGAPVAGMSVVRFGSSCEYHIGWFGPEGRKLNAGNLLMWSIMREMKLRGATTFDVGGMSDGSGYTQFKRTMRPLEYELDGEWMAF